MLGADIVEHGTGGLFTSSDIAADSAVSLTALGDDILDTEFKVKTNKLLRDLFRSISRYVAIQNREVYATCQLRLVCPGTGVNKRLFVLFKASLSALFVHSVK